MKLDIRDLTVRIADRTIVEGLDLTIGDGERVGLVGESGSGKSMTALAVLGLLPRGAQVSGSILLDGVELVGAREGVLAGMRGSHVGMVFQDPRTALDPLRTVGSQLVEGRRLRQRLTRRSARAEAVRLAERVRLPGDVVSRYPHELSGGQRQRVAIGMAIASSPGLLVADEPTTALDVTIQAEILALFDELCEREGMSLLFITHDLAVLSRVASAALVLSEGRVVERGRVDLLLARPEHPVTRSLLDAARATSWSSR